MCFGGDSGGGNTSTVVQQSSLPPVVDQGLQQLLAMGTAGANIPYTAYTAPRIAGFTDMQNQGFAQTGTAANAYQPYLDQSQQYTQQGAQPIAPTLGSFDQSAFQQYGNPYTQDVINSSNQEIQRQGTIGNQTIAGNAAQAGAFGGDRATVAQTENNRNTLNTIARNTDTLNQQNYQQAQGQFNTEQNRGLAARESDQSAAARAAGAEAALGGQAQQQGLTGASALLGAGAQQQQQNQSGLNLAYSDFKQQQLWPQEQATYLNSIIHGLNTPTGSTTTSPGPSIAGQVGGLAATGIGAIGATGGFGSQGWLTQAFNGGSAASNATISAQAADDVGNSANAFFARGGHVGYAPGGTVDPDSYPGPDQYSMDTASAEQSGYPDQYSIDQSENFHYPAPIGPQGDTQVNILAGMSDRELVAARYNPQFSRSLVDEQIQKRGMDSRFGSFMSGIGKGIRSAGRWIGEGVQNPSDDVDASQIGRQGVAAAGRGIGAATDYLTEPVVPPGIASERTKGDMPLELPPQSERAATGGVDPNQYIPPAASERYGQDPIPTVPGVKSASAAEGEDASAGSGGTSVEVPLPPAPAASAAPTGIGGPTLVAGGAHLLPDGNQRPVGSPGGPAAPPPAPQQGIGGPPSNIDRNGIAPAVPRVGAAPPTGARVPAPVPPVVASQGIGGAQPGGPPLGIDHNGIAPAAAPASSAHPDWVNGTPPIAPAPATPAASPNALSGINPWLALAKAGGQMAASKSPFALTAAGEGALAGVSDIEHQQQIAAASGLKQAELARKTAQDRATAAYQLSRISSRDELTRQQAQWHQDEIAARREAASERSMDRRMALMQHADALAQNQQLAQQRIDELHSANDQKASNAADMKTKSAETAYESFLKAHGAQPGMPVDPVTEGNAQNHIIDVYGDTPQGKAFKAARDTPTAMPTDKTQAIPRQVYQTPKGAMRWNGAAFEAP